MMALSVSIWIRLDMKDTLNRVRGLALQILELTDYDEDEGYRELATRMVKLSGLLTQAKDAVCWDYYFDLKYWKDRLGLG